MSVIRLFNTIAMILLCLMLCSSRATAQTDAFDYGYIQVQYDTIESEEFPEDPATGGAVSWSIPVSENWHLFGTGRIVEGEVDGENHIQNWIDTGLGFNASIVDNVDLVLRVGAFFTDGWNSSDLLTWDYEVGTIARVSTRIRLGEILELEPSYSTYGSGGSSRSDAGLNMYLSLGLQVEAYAGTHDFETFAFGIRIGAS